MTVHQLQPRRTYMREEDRRHILTLWAAKMDTSVIAGLTGFSEAQVYNVIARRKTLGV